jgi:hypothetical protein
MNVGFCPISIVEPGEDSNRRRNSVGWNFGGTFYGIPRALASLLVLFAVSPILHVILSLILDRSFRISPPGEVSDQIRYVREQNGFFGGPFRIRPWFNLFTGGHFQSTMPGHSRMLCA